MILNIQVHEFRRKQFSVSHRAVGANLSHMQVKVCAAASPWIGDHLNWMADKVLVLNDFLKNHKQIDPRINSYRSLLAELVDVLKGREPSARLLYLMLQDKLCYLPFLPSRVNILLKSETNIGDVLTEL